MISLLLFHVLLKKKVLRFSEIMNSFLFPFCLVRHCFMYFETGITWTLCLLGHLIDHISHWNTCIRVHACQYIHTLLKGLIRAPTVRTVKCYHHGICLCILNTLTLIFYRLGPPPSHVINSCGMM